MHNRLFLGVSPAPEHILQLTSLQQTLTTDGQAVPRANLHMTLAFLGQVSPTATTQLIDELNQLSAQRKLSSFSVCLNELILWPKAKALCLVARLDDPHLVALQHLCQQVAANLGLHQQQHPFTPHITLFRKTKQFTPQATEPITLNANTLHLFQSVSDNTGVHYPIMHSWSLVEPKP
ncbi:RNA 2',3'-cyclic phosphodiesterase [Shewanella algidipiscicola]|uniref:RNA 2',3'-cyclic phosphodiesterase n=1 Tax=Shewanella algidipiscicola TaxID=614070 RepID=A0ABQ4PAR5_9GAMM|nr:RNA 2',3'-cyclic phosphodiesterase [Shewanella algidipiscicola]GIU44652.1 RNA 2',3'-cyclic phosphodiesterase [Shewanella algidipiscicola]